MKFLNGLEMQTTLDNRRSQTGIFQLRFELKEDEDKILDGRPWTCKGAQFLTQQ